MPARRESLGSRTVSRFVARGCLRGPELASSGAALPEILAVLAIAALVFALIVPGATQLKSSVAIRSAASETTTAFALARAFAIRRGVYVGLKFRKNGDRYEWTAYRDGNHNGVRSAEIARGVDPPAGVFFPWNRNDVRPGILTTSPVPDPSRPGQSLDRVGDPIRFNGSDICSFSPVGESTPGSVYLWDGKDRMAVVRVFGRTAKIRVLYYRLGESEWKP
ncbi:MAG TPA: GspH/FimT family pseudopilin [Thermoanaerobaculia bacterium]|nr:GspH/FimT family pseudopilin [Thermoanaerobaculia bacterium]